MTAKQSLAETTYFCEQRRYLAGLLARMVATGEHPDSTKFSETYTRFVQNGVQLVLQKQIKTPGDD